jgi:hypothetical protein
MMDDRKDFEAQRTALEKIVTLAREEVRQCTYVILHISIGATYYPCPMSITEFVLLWMK